jgi:hypothetical protein
MFIVVTEFKSGELVRINVNSIAMYLFENEMPTIILNNGLKIRVPDRSVKDIDTAIESLKRGAMIRV